MLLVNKCRYIILTEKNIEAENRLPTPSTFCLLSKSPPLLPYLLFLMENIKTDRIPQNIKNL